MEDTLIEWAHHTFNPWWGCTKVSPACANCYAEALAKRYGNDIWGKKKPRRFFGKKHWQQPYAWNEDAADKEIRQRVFCASMADVFEDRRDLDPWRAQLWPIVEATTSLDWLFLTKRPENMRSMTPWPISWPVNAWAMTTAENQELLLARWEHLRLVPARIFGLSIEPMLSEIDLTPVFATMPEGAQLWVIAGGESGPQPRPTPVDWFLSLRDQCAEAGAPFFFKQWGVLPANASPTGKFLPKKKSGRELGGQTWDNFPVTPEACSVTQTKCITALI